jgi:hypothetical protein
MKKLILLAVLMVSTVATFGQGFIIFANSSTTGITNSVTGLGAVGSAADQTDTQVGLYLGTVGTPVGSLTLVAQTNFNNPGRFSGGTREINGFNPGTVTVQIRAWLAATVYPSYEAAVAAAFGGDGSVLLGVSAPFDMTMVGVGGVPLSTATSGLQRFNISPVPEPSSIALGLLGLGAVALFRRRK